MEPVNDKFYAMIWTGVNRRAKLLYGPWDTEDEARENAKNLFSYWVQSENPKSPINDINRCIVDAKYGRLYRETGKGNRGYFVDGPKVELRDLADFPDLDGAAIVDKEDITAFLTQWDNDNTDPETLECFGPMIDDFCVDCTDIDNYQTQPGAIPPTDGYYAITVSPYSPSDLVDSIALNGWYSLLEIRDDEIQQWLSEEPKVWGISQIAFPGQEHYDDEDAVLAGYNDVALDPWARQYYMANTWFARWFAGEYRRPDIYTIYGNDAVYIIDDADDWVNSGCSAGFQWGFQNYVPFWDGNKTDRNVDRYLDHWYVHCEIFAQVGTENGSDTGRSYYAPNLSGTDDYNRFPAIGNYYYVEPIYDTVFSGELPPDSYFFGKSWIEGKKVHFHKPTDGDGDNVYPWAIGVRFSVMPVFRVAGAYADCDLFQNGNPYVCTIIGRSKRNHVIGNTGTNPGDRRIQTYNPTGAEKFSSAPWDYGFFVDDNPNPANAPTTDTKTRTVLLGWDDGGLSREDLDVLNEWLGNDYLANVKTLFRLPAYRKLVAFLHVLNGYTVNPSPIGYNPDTGHAIYPFPVIIGFDGAEGTPDPRGNPIYGEPVYGQEQLQTFDSQNGVN